MSIRDSQVSKVYHLDDRLQYEAAQKEVTIYKEGLSLIEMQAITDSLFVGLHQGKSPEVKDGRRCRSALGGVNWVKMPRWSRNHVILCHELAHCYIQRVDPGHKRFAPHGAEYMFVYRSFLIRLGLFTKREVDFLAEKNGVQIREAFHLTHTPVDHDAIAKDVCLKSSIKVTQKKIVDSDREKAKEYIKRLGATFEKNGDEIEVFMPDGKNMGGYHSLLCTDWQDVIDRLCSYEPEDVVPCDRECWCGEGQKVA